MGKPEGVIEDYLAEQCKKHDCLCYKFTSPSRSGVPDRIVIGHAQTVFVELKAPGEKPRKLQKAVIHDMRIHGAIVYVIDTKAGVDELMDERFRCEQRQHVPRSAEARCVGTLRIE